MVREAASEYFATGQFASLSQRGFASAYEAGIVLVCVAPMTTPSITKSQLAQPPLRISMQVDAANCVVRYELVATCVDSRTHVVVTYADNYVRRRVFQELHRVEVLIETAVFEAFLASFRGALAGTPGDGGNYGWWVEHIRVSGELASAWEGEYSYLEASTGPAGDVLDDFLDSLVLMLGAVVTEGPQSWLARMFARIGTLRR